MNLGNDDASGAMGVGEGGSGVGKGSRGSSDGVGDGGGLGIDGRGSDVVANGDGGGDVLDDGGDGSVSVALLHLIGEVATKTVGLDVGAIESRGADQGGGRDRKGIGGSQANQENSQLGAYRKTSLKDQIQRG